MSKIDASVLWGPKVVGKDRLDEHRWAYVVEATFDMPAELPLIGVKASLDGHEFEIRGFVRGKCSAWFDGTAGSARHCAQRTYLQGGLAAFSFIGVFRLPS